MVSNMDQYIIHNLTWSEVYLIINFYITIIQKVLTLLTMTENEPYVYVTTLKTIICYLYSDLEDALDNLKSIKLNSNLGGGVEYLFAAIFVYAENPESFRAFNTGNIG